VSAGLSRRRPVAGLSRRRWPEQFCPAVGLVQAKSEQDLAVDQVSQSIEPGVAVSVLINGTAGHVEVLRILHPPIFVFKSFNTLLRRRHLVALRLRGIARLDELLLLWRLVEMVPAQVRERDLVAFRRVQIEIVRNDVEGADRIRAQLLLDGDVVL
jgi:hypothetical protein